MDLVYSNKSKEYTIEKGCPWYEAQQTYGAPNVNWCEPTICSVINEPANTWSNLSYMLFALLMLKKLSEYSKAFLKDFGIGIFIMGACSFIYHASNNFATQFLDFAGMFILSSFVMSLGWQRFKHNRVTNYREMFWMLMFFETCLFWWFYLEDIAIQKMFMICILGMVIAEFTCVIKEKFIKQSGHLGIALIFIVIAQVFSILDIKRIWCEPANMFLHGHALWHMFGGVSMFFLFLHFRKVMKSYDQK